MTSGIEKLVIGAIYPATAFGKSREHSQVDPQNLCDPCWDLNHPKTGKRYFGWVSFNTSSNLSLQGESNDIRYDLIHQIDSSQGPAPVDVQILRHIGTNPLGPYVGTAAREGDLENSLDIDLARYAIKSDRVFYGLFSFVGSNNVKGDGDSGFAVLDSGFIELGYLQPKRLHRTNDRTQRIRLDEEADLSQRIIADLEIGDYMLLRTRRKDRKSERYFFEPVLNFKPGDYAFDHEGNRVVTRVDGIQPGNLIHNLPILLSRDLESGEQVGVGVIPDTTNPIGFYKPVYVRDSTDRLGHYVAKSEIIEVTPRRIIASNVS